MELSALILEGQTGFWLLFVLAMGLGGLHGLEPGHSKTMMAAFIIAVRGSVGQAVVLGLSAAVAHSFIVWVLAVLALSTGNALIGEQLEPWLLIISGVVVLVLAAWMMWQVIAPARRVTQAHHHHSDHGHSHEHSHGHSHGHPHQHPHGHVGQGHVEGLDAHAAGHARQIEQQFSGGSATWAQTITFGLTGGLLPCTAAITVLILCLNLERFWFGMGLVAGFSLGLALTLVTVGVVAALGLNALRNRSGIVDRLFAHAPYISAGLVGFLGLVMLASGAWHLLAAH